MPEKFATPWQKFAKRWDKYYTAPGRPSVQAIKQYRKFIKVALSGKKHPKILVLGATPELRDLAAEFKSAQVCAIDLNMEMILAMTQLCRKKNSNEILVRGNWISTPFTSDYFDVVLGDIVLENVPNKFHHRFHLEIRRILKTGGYFIQKMAVAPNDFNFESTEKIFKKYAHIPLTRTLPMEFFCHFHTTVFNPKTKTINCQNIKKRWKKWWKNGQYRHPSRQITYILNQMWQMWKPLTKQWSFDFEKNVAKEVSKYFKIEQKIVLSDCYYPEVNETFPIWICKVKKAV